jgi:hypothetical protein
MEPEALKKLTERFFKSLNSEVMWKDKILFVNKVPLNFEKLFGKKSPYQFVFEIEDNGPDTEIITKGSSLIKVIADYLNNKAQISLLKIKLSTDFKSELKKNIDFKDYKITGISEKARNSYIYRFTIMTTFQYLNEKEQLINSIYISNKELLNNFNPDNYETFDGKKEEVSFDNIKDNYFIAKERLKPILQKRIDAISALLNKSLEKEICRIELHYKSELGEINSEINNSIKKIQELNEKFEKASGKNKDILKEKIERSNVNFDKLTKSEEKEKFEKEKSFFINDEKHKHSLNISNNLMNTTLIYYPYYELSISIKKEESPSSKEIKLEYDPLKKRFTALLCESCKKDTKEINICSSNHITCKDCISKCPSCLKLVCNSCKKSFCIICTAKLCQKCESICFKCLKPVCKSHCCKDSITGRNLCNNCSEYCECCKKFTIKSNFKKCESCRNNICGYCTRTKMTSGKGKSKIICKNCEK